jgi:hypothetical protein
MRRRRKPRWYENLLLERECGFESRRPHHLSGSRDGQFPGHQLRWRLCTCWAFSSGNNECNERQALPSESRSREFESRPVRIQTAGTGTLGGHICVSEASLHRLPCPKRDRTPPGCLRRHLRVTLSACQARPRPLLCNLSALSTTRQTDGRCNGVHLNGSTCRKRPTPCTTP